MIISYTKFPSEHPQASEASVLYPLPQPPTAGTHLPVLPSTFIKHIAHLGVSGFRPISGS